MWLWRWMIVTSACLALGCAAIGLVEWYVFTYGITDLDCAMDPAAPNGCVPPWEPRPKAWLMAAAGFAAVAALGIAHIEVHWVRDRFQRAPTPS